MIFDFKFKCLYKNEFYLIYYVTIIKTGVCEGLSTNAFTKTAQKY
jgi:hypothetical protein